MEFLYKNCNISFDVKGKGTAVVLLHGFLESKEMWKDISSSLSKKNKIISIDLLGHGESENLSYIHTMEEQADMVKSLLNHLRLRKYFLIGHSMGGYIASAFAKKYPNNVKGISLVNSTTLPDSDEKKTNRERGIQVVKKNKNTFIKTAVPLLFSEKSKNLYKKEIDEVIQRCLKTSIQGIIAALEGMKIRKDLSNLHKNSTFPIQMIIGKQDVALNYKQLLSETKNTNTEVIEYNCGHMSYIEDRDVLIQALSSFVK